MPGKPLHILRYPTGSIRIRLFASDYGNDAKTVWLRSRNESPYIYIPGGQESLELDKSFLYESKLSTFMICILNYNKKLCIYKRTTDL